MWMKKFQLLFNISSRTRSLSHKPNGPIGIKDDLRIIADES